MSAPLQKEGPLLRVEQGKWVVDIQLRHIGFDLREVGVQRQIPGQARSDAPFGRQAELGLGAAVLQITLGKVLALVGPTRSQGRHQLDVAPGVGALETGGLRDLAKVAAHTPIHGLAGHPDPVAAGIEADRVEAPGQLFATARKSKLVEGNRHFDDVTFFRDATCRGPDRVPGRCLIAAQIVVEQIHLHAERIDEKLEGPSLIVEGVQHDADEVVVEGRVPIDHVGSNGLRIIVVGLESDIDMTAAVGDQTLGLHRRRDVLARAGLILQVDSGSFLPRRLVELGIDFDR